MRGTADICGLAQKMMVPSTAMAIQRAPPGRTLAACAGPRLARSVRLHAICSLPTMLVIAPALASARGQIQSPTIFTFSHAAAGIPVPCMHGRSLVDEAIAVLHCLLEHLCSLVIRCEIHVGQELPDGHKSKMVGTASRLEVATLQPRRHGLLGDFLFADLVLEQGVTTQSHTLRMQ